MSQQVRDNAHCWHIMRVRSIYQICRVFLSGVFEISRNKADSLRGLLTMPVILLKDKQIHSAAESYRAP